MTITRRGILTGAAGLCATSAIGAISGGLISQAHETSNSPQRTKAKTATTPMTCPGATPFSIILHGLFFVELWDSKTPSEQRVRIISPKCPNMGIAHQHVAGSWKNKKFSNISGVSAPGWQSATTVMPDVRGLPTLAGCAGQVLNSKIHHSLYLPWPDSITPLRNVDPSLVNNSGLGSPSSFPLALALTYECGAPQDQPPIDQTDWSKDYNFHIFCEPKCTVPCDQFQTHAKETIECIKESFGATPSFTLMPKSWDCSPVPTDKPPSGSHIDQGEESALSEIQPCPSTAAKEHVFSVHLPMCASLILTQ